MKRFVAGAVLLKNRHSQGRASRAIGPESANRVPATCSQVPGTRIVNCIPYSMPIAIYWDIQSESLNVATSTLDHPKMKIWIKNLNDMTNDVTNCSLALSRPPTPRYPDRGLSPPTVRYRGVGGRDNAKEDKLLLEHFS
eukprot:614034-Prorocentrum_minimum.AAC.2